jgi:hypothetical protein
MTLRLLLVTLVGCLVTGLALADPAPAPTPILRLVVPATPHAPTATILVAPVPGAVSDACARGTVCAHISPEAIDAVCRGMGAMRPSSETPHITVVPHVNIPGLLDRHGIEIAPEEIPFPSVRPELRLRPER